MRSTKNQSGFSAIEVVIVVAVVAIVGYLGYTFYNGYQDKMAKSSDISNVSDAESVPEITTAAQLNEASGMIDQADVESSNSDDLSELDKELSSF